MANATKNAEKLQYASLLRRLGAIVYDALATFALVLIAAFAALPVTRGESQLLADPLYTSYIFVVCYGYFAWCWMHGGQTLGMLAWRIRVQTCDARPLTPWHALLRFFASMGSWLLFGSGFVYALFNRDRITWHDRFSETVLVRL